MWSSPSAAPTGCWSWRGSTRTARVLIEGYDYGGKDREDVTEELVERAIDLGYLSGGETVSITVTSADADWQAREEQAAREDLEERYGETIVIQIGPADGGAAGHRGSHPGDAPRTGAYPRTTPEPVPEPMPAIRPAVPSATGDHGLRSRPGNADGVTDYEDTDYGPYSDGVTDYEPPDDGPYVDGDTDYEDRDDGDDRDDDDDDWDDDDDDDGDDDGERDDDD